MEVSVEVSATGATIGTDFDWTMVDGAPAPRIVSIADGAAEQSFSVQLIDDNDYEVCAPFPCRVNTLFAQRGIEHVAWPVPRS